MFNFFFNGEVASCRNGDGEMVLRQVATAICPCSINVYSCGDKNKIYPLHINNNEKSDHYDLVFRLIYSLLTLLSSVVKI
ncbi:hypothetical protein QTP88_020754 [Uroleucon formosanum]